MNTQNEKRSVESQKYLAKQRGIKNAIQSEFDKTGVYKIEYTWNLSHTFLSFPHIEMDEEIKAISKNGIKCKSGFFYYWMEFENFDDLKKILTFLKQFNFYLNSEAGPVTWEIAKKSFFDSTDVKDPNQFLWAFFKDYGMYFPAHKLKKPVGPK